MTTTTLLRATSIALLVAGSLAAPIAAQAQEGPWLVRVRAVNLDSANKDTTGLALSVNNKTIPEIDFSYFVTPNIAAELILTVPQKHTVYAGGTAIGSLKHLPPTLTVQYHFTGLPVKPYVGAGLNYTKITNDKLSSGYSLDGESFGAAFQAGWPVRGAVMRVLLVLLCGLVALVPTLTTNNVVLSVLTFTCRSEWLIRMSSACLTCRV